MNLVIEMSNKMRKYFLGIVLLCYSLVIYGFDPIKSDFASDYQFELYRSWVRKGNFKTDLPVRFTKDKIFKSFDDQAGNQVKIIYDWKNFKICEQWEEIPFKDYLTSLEMKTYRIFLQSFVYRLNSDIDTFLFDLCDPTKVEINYSGFKDLQALELLITDFTDRRFKIIATEPFSKNDQIGFRLIAENDISVEILFSEFSEIFTALIKQKEKEKSKIITKKPPEKKVIIPSIPKKTVPKPKVFSGSIEDLDLQEYIDLFYQKMQTKEILHNKIKNVHKFLKNEFPHHRISENGQHYFMEIEPFKNDFPADISLFVKNYKDGISLIPDTMFEIENKNVFLKTGEKFDLSNLTEEEVENMAPFLSQMIFEHRSIGTRLLNFFLIHDGVSTSLIVHGDERKLYDIYSYANLLLMLNEYWKDRIVYFSMQEIKKVNGYIEFKGYLIADDPAEDTYDLAEIRYHLDKNYKIDLVMMFLHPETRK